MRDPSHCSHAARHNHHRVERIRTACKRNIHALRRVSYDTLTQLQSLRQFLRNHRLRVLAEDDMHFMLSAQIIQQPLRIQGAARAGDSNNNSHPASFPHQGRKLKLASTPQAPNGCQRVKLSRAKPPLRWRKDIDYVLIPAPLIRQRVKLLARQIESDFKDREFVIVSLLSGTVLFLADLIRNIQLPLRLDFMGVSSYREGTTSRELVFTKELRLDVRGRDVLLVDDILDTGRTFEAVLARLNDLRPASVRTCVLLDKKARRIVPIQADYAAFEIPDLFVVGYGLDFAERYRNLPFVGVLHPNLYRAQ